MKLQNCVVILLASLVLVSSHPEKDKKDAELKEHKLTFSTSDKKQDQRGLGDIELIGYDFGKGNALKLRGRSIIDEGHIKAITITKKVKVPVPRPYPVHIEKKLPVKVPVYVEKKVPIVIHEHEGLEGGFGGGHGGGFGRGHELELGGGIQLGGDFHH